MCTQQPQQTYKTEFSPKGKAEAELKKLFTEWNALKRSLVLKDNATTQAERDKFELEFHKLLLGCELRMRGIQGAIREIE